MIKPIDLTKLSIEQLETLISRHQQRQLTSDPSYRSAVAEYGRRAAPELRVEVTIAEIRSAAFRRSFISYGELARASGADWSKVRRKMPPHLQAVLWRCHHAGWPLITSIVVNQQHLATGEMEEQSLSGFVAGARKLGLMVADEVAFLKTEQARTFEWGSIRGADKLQHWQGLCWKGERTSKLKTVEGRMKAPTEKQLRAMTPEQRLMVRMRAVDLGGEIGNATVTLIDSLNLPLSSGGMSEDHPLYREMQELVWSAEGKAAAIQAVNEGLPAMAGIDPLLQKAMGDRYGREYQGTMNAGYIVGELMRFLGFEKVGEAELPPNCVAKTAATWRSNKPLPKGTRGAAYS